MRYGYVTFRAHTNEKFLDEEFLTLIQPMFMKTKIFLLGEENVGTPERHYHLIFNVPDSADLTNIEARFDTKPFKSFKTRIKNENYSTQWSNCFFPEIVGNTDHDYTYTLGYCAKENVYQTKGLTDDEITKAVKYYHLTKRNEASKGPPLSWKILTIKNSHSYIEWFADKHSLDLADPYLKLKLKQEKIHLDMTPKKRNEVFDELYYANNYQEENKNIKNKEKMESSKFNIVNNHNVMNHDATWYIDCINMLRVRVAELEEVNCMDENEKSNNKWWMKQSI
jgi:hypothetical protein